MKTLLSFDEKLIAVGAIQFISKGEEYSSKWQQLIYTIIINDKALYENIPQFPQIKYEYLNEEFRNKKFKELFNKLADFEHIEILE